jgi:hypothetical protein
MTLGTIMEKSVLGQSEGRKSISGGRVPMRNEDLQEIDKARICFSKKDNLSTEHFIELIEKRVEGCYAWERKCRAHEENQ